MANQLATYTGLVQGLHELAASDSIYGRHTVSNLLTGKVPARLGEIYCPICGDVRGQNVQFHFCPVDVDIATSGAQLYGRPTRESLLMALATSSSAPKVPISKSLAPSLMTYICVQCTQRTTAVIFVGSNGQEIALFHRAGGGIKSPHTPEGVAFYLDQAFRSRTAGAYSACVAMYRGALDALLLQQGFTGRMLGDKLKQFDKAIAEQTAPKWAMDLNAAFLAVLKDLGNGSIHPGADINKQSALDQELTWKVEAAFQMILGLVYEKDVREQRLLLELQSAKTKLVK